MFKKHQTELKSRVSFTNALFFVAGEQSFRSFSYVPDQLDKAIS
jgi:hypothetical protein